MADAMELLKHTWELWDVRVMIIVSALIQILLFMLGNCRKYMVNPYLKIVVWIAYISADWVATATLGKLASNCNAGSAPNNFLSGLWASTLLLHLGGPDTITAYALEDNQLWTRHLLGLLIEATLAVYVISLSWSRSWLSLLNLPLFIAGIIKYFERTWSLYCASRKDLREKPPLFQTGFQGNEVTDFEWISRFFDETFQLPTELTDAKKILMAHQWFAWMRPDRNNYLSVNDKDCIRGRLRAPPENEFFIRSLMYRTPSDCLFDVVTTELGITFDMLYTKGTIIYTKLGCILRLISFFCTLFVLVFITAKRKVVEPRRVVDLYITQSLLVASVALELYGLFLIVYSDWFVVLKIIYRDPSKSFLMRGILKSIDSLSSKALQQKKKRWSNSVGQFSLFGYFVSLKKEKWMNKMLQTIGIQEKLAQHWQTSFVAVPCSLLNPCKFLWYGIDNNFDICTKGEKTLKKEGYKSWKNVQVKVTDLDQSIVIWHMVTDILYSIQKESGSITDESITTCRVISDYMMYLLVMKPHMISLDKSIWFDSIISHLDEVIWQEDGEFDRFTTEIFNLFPTPFGISAYDSTGDCFNQVVNPVRELVDFLKINPKKWDILSSCWIEILRYAAINCPHVCHLQELRQGGESLSLCWLLLNTGLWYYGYGGDTLQL